MWKKEQIGKAVLYLGDCKEILSQLKSEKQTVAAVITDPPYGIGRKYTKAYNDTHIDYPAWLWERLLIAEELCSPGSPVFVFQSTLNVRKFSKWFLRDWRLYIAAKNFVQMSKNSVMTYGYDCVVCWWSPGKPYTRGTRNRDFFLSNTAIEVSRTKNLSREHPYPRPLAQMYVFLEQWVRPGGCVLDPFMGGGTTLVAAEQLGLSSIGIEIEEKYFDLACTRVHNAAKLGWFFSR